MTCSRQGRVGLAGQGLGEGSKGFGSGGGVGGRGTDPRNGANFATCVVFLFLTRKKKKMAFLKGALWGGGGTHRSWLGGRGVDEGPWLQERLGGGGGMAVPKKGDWLAVPKRGKSPGKGWLAWQFHRRRQANGSRKLGVA